MTSPLETQITPRKRGRLVARWIITLGLLAVVATQVDFLLFGSVIQNMHWGWVAVAAAAAYVDRVIATVRWWVLLRVKKIDIRFAPLLNLHMAANLVGGFLPTSFGADAARIVMLSRHSGKAMQTVAASAADRLVMIAATIAAALIMSSVFVRAHFPPVVQWGLVIAGAACLVSLGVFIALGRSRLIGGACRAALGERVAGTLSHLYWSICEYRQSPAVLLQCLGISCAMLALRGVLLVAMAAAFGIDLHLATGLVLWPIVAVILMLPVSVGNVGLQEGTYVAILGLIGIPATLAVSVSLLDHILARAVVLPGALCWLWAASPPDRLPGAEAVKTE